MIIVRFILNGKQKIQFHLLYGNNELKSPPLLFQTKPTPLLNILKMSLMHLFLFNLPKSLLPLEVS